jgi:hypothetical protein
VSLLLFSVVMIVALGAIVTMIDANRKSRAQKTVGDNIDAAMESMTRAIRDGTVYHCDAGIGTSIDIAENCPPQGSSLFAFEPLGGDPNTVTDQVVYKLENNSIKRSLDGGANFLSLTAPEVVIENMTFRTVSYSASPDEQPKVLIVVSGKVGGDGPSGAAFHMQTTVSQRFTDFLRSVPLIDVGGWPQEPTCPFFPSVKGRTVVDFEDFAPGYPGHLLYDTVTERGPFTLLEPIWGGFTYKVSATSYDDHCGIGGPPDCPYWLATNERMYIELLNSNNEVLYISQASPDIDDEENQPQFVLNDAYWTNGTPPDAVKIKAYHVGSPVDSLHPVCYAFDRVFEVSEF